MADEEQDQAQVRGLLLPTGSEPLVVPHAAVAEIVNYREPEAVEGAPPWLSGCMSWRGQRVPVIAFETLISGEALEADATARFAVLNTVGGDASPRFIALLMQGIPRMVRLDRSVIAARERPAADRRRGIRLPVTLHGEPAVIPDLDELETLAKPFAA